MKKYELVVKNGRLAIPFTGVIEADLGIKNGKIAAIAAEIPSSEAEEAFDAAEHVVFPGAVDSHFHIGIYRPFSGDAESESASATIGGVTSIISYFRTGHNYLNKTGPYSTMFPEVLNLSEKHFYTDYGYHLALMTTDQLGEIDALVEEHGVGSFKFYMFYKGLNLSADSTRGDQYTMADNYDLGHLYLLMEKVTEVAKRHRGKGRISLSLHCENPELIRVFIDKVKRQALQGLRAYSEARPPLTEHLSITEAVLLAEATGCPVNLLHLSSREALEAGITARRQHPELDIVLETTLHHLCLSWEALTGVRGKVNPPIRSQKDVESLWRGVTSGEVDTIVSDHACCMEEEKKEDDIWSSLPGFGGSSLLYPVLLSEGFAKRKLSLTRIAELASANPARHFGMFPRKGTLAVGSDADLAVVSLDRVQQVSAHKLHSAQTYTPFEGTTLKGWPVATFLRGRMVQREGELLGRPEGAYIKRPIQLHAEESPRRLAA